LDVEKVKIIVITPNNDISVDIKDPLMKSFPKADFSECIFSADTKSYSGGNERLKKLKNLVRTI
jgi:hypothetical protein